ncbi:MAG TPA: hypothetical protein VJG83_06615 [archaeon]|nr:hypothetical protein [archaeon]
MKPKKNRQLMRLPAERNFSFYKIRDVFSKTLLTPQEFEELTRGMSASEKYVAKKSMATLQDKAELWAKFKTILRTSREAFAQKTNKPAKPFWLLIATKK